MDDPERKDRGERAADVDRRTVLGTASSVVMVGGLVGGYGGLAAMAGRFLYPARPTERAWQFVAAVDEVAVGDAISYRTPEGSSVTITRLSETGTADDFIALSSTCPHLGCQVHWQPTQGEGGKGRFFCPCHNGVFTPEGKAIAGPPGEAGQELPRYPLKVVGGVLFIEVPMESLAAAGTDDGASRVAGTTRSEDSTDEGRVT